jgi:hypothetical protein
MWPEHSLDEEDTPRGYKPGLLMVLITLLLVLAMLATLVGRCCKFGVVSPLRQRRRYCRKRELRRDQIE